MGRFSHRKACHPRPVALVLLVASLVVVLPAPGGAFGATLTQAQRQLLSWHLTPAPLFPAGLAGTDVALSRFSPLDYDVSFTRPGCAGPFCVDLRRLTWGALDSILNDPLTTDVRQVQVGNRVVFAVRTGHNQITCAQSRALNRTQARIILAGSRGTKTHASAIASASMASCSFSVVYFLLRDGSWTTSSPRQTMQW